MNIRSNIRQAAWPTIALAVVSVASFVALAAAAAAGALPWGITIPLQAVAAFAGFTPLHDASHHAVSRAQWLNDAIGWICGLPILAPYSAFRYLHGEHHAWTNDRARDPDMWSSKARTRPGIFARWLVMDLHYLARYLTELRSRPRAESVASAAALVAMWTSWVLAIATGHGLELLVCWLVPARLAILTLSIVFDWIPHHPRDVTRAEDPYRASNAYEHAWLTPLLLGQNYHLVHHLVPGVPFYRYGHAYRAMRAELEACGADLRRIGRPRRPPLDHRGELLRVAEVIEETADTRTFVLEEFRPYRAGQFVVVHGPGGLRRCYSLSRAPEDGVLAITVKRQGRLSTWLHEHVSAGGRLRIGAPEGRFVLTRGSERPLALVAGGSGITPVIAILDSALRTTQRRATLLYANRDPEHIVFAPWLASLARTHADRFTLVHHLDDEHGTLDLDRIAAHLDREAELYTCGPAGLLDLAERAAERAGIPRERRFCERFTPRAGGGQSAGGRQLRAPAASFTAIHRGARHTIPIAHGESLLRAAWRAGLDPRASCGDGYCGTCAARLVCGRVDTRSYGPLDDGELARGFILPCSARALAGEREPVIIDFDAAP